MKSRSKSVLLVTVDCMRADHAGFMGYDRETTPFLDSLAAESFVIPTAITGGAPTYYSFPSILSSRYPLALGRNYLGLAPGEATLATTLKQAGYKTAAFCAGNPYLSRMFGYDQGFDCFEDFLTDHPMEEVTPVRTGNGSWRSALNRGLQRISHKFDGIGAIYDELYFQYCQWVSTRHIRSVEEHRPYPSAETIVCRALDWLSSVGDEPFFLWLHLMDPHWPYYPNREALEALGIKHISAPRARYLNAYWNRSDLTGKRLKRHRHDVIAMYDTGIRWVDMQISKLVGALREDRRWDNCIFALTADHGEEFLDHGGRYHPPSRLMEELIHVPLLLRVPGVSPKAVCKAPFSHIHLAPTLLDAAGVAYPESFSGQALWQHLQQGRDWDMPAISECVADCTNPFRSRSRVGPRVLAVRESRYKLMLNFGTKEDWLYDLEADAQEQSPLHASGERVVRRRLLDIARRHVLGSHNHNICEAQLRLRLRDLQQEWAASVRLPN